MWKFRHWLSKLLNSLSQILQVFAQELIENDPAENTLSDLRGSRTSMDREWRNESRYSQRHG